MTRLTTIFTTLYALYSLPLIFAWEFVWRDANGTATVQNGTAAQRCKAIDQAQGQPFEFDPDDDLMRLYMYPSTNCSTTSSEKHDTYVSKNASVASHSFAVIDLRGANTSTEGPLEPFPGEEWFLSSPNSPIVTAMGKRLVAEGCGKYSDAPGPQWTESDRKSYQCWQGKLGYTGTSANGWPGRVTWDQLKVPLSDGPSNTDSSSTETPSSTDSATSTPVPGTGSSGSSLSGGAIAGIVVGCVVGVGLIAAILYLARRIKRQSTPATGENEQEREPEGGGDGGANTADNTAAAAAAAAEEEESKRSSLDKLPAEAEAIPAKEERKHFAELQGDLGSSELSESRRINELSDSRRVVEMGEK